MKRLRPYQERAVSAIFDAWQTASSTLGVLPTGTGKTIIFGHVIAQRRGGKAMILAHREELIWQASDKVGTITGERPEIEMAEMQAGGLLTGGDIIVSTIQTQCSGEGGEGRMSKFDPFQFGLLIVDEAHHATASTYRRVIDYYRQNPNLKVLGVTATPDRADEEALGQVFESVAFEYELIDAIRDGWLVPIQQRAVTIEGLDYSSVRTKAGDLNGADLERVLQAEEVPQSIVSATLDLAAGRKALVFAVGKDQAQMLMDIFNRYGDIARFVHGKTPREERRVIFEDFKHKRFQILVNVGVATEGFDDPGIEVVVMARPTKSRALYSQMAGRGTRVHPDAGIDSDSALTAADRRALIGFSCKPCCEIIDFVGNSGRHRLITTADILGGKHSDEAVEKAREMAQSAGGGPMDMEQALDDAERELAAKREEARKAGIRAKALYSTTVKDPFAMLGIEPWHERGWHKGRLPTEKQLAFLEKSGIPIEGVKTFTQASQLVDTVMSRRTAGLCTPKQASLLRRFGYDPSSATFEQASEIITTIKANGWKRPGAPAREVTVY